MNPLPPPPTWMRDALCAQTGPDDYVWFGPAGVTPTAARRLCAKCPVRGECLEYALETRPDGIWAGTTERQRRKLRKDSAA